MLQGRLHHWDPKLCKCKGYAKKIICRETYKKPCLIVENTAYVAVAISNIFEMENTFYISQVCTYITVLFTVNGVNMM